MLKPRKKWLVISFDAEADGDHGEGQVLLDVVLAVSETQAIRRWQAGRPYACLDFVTPLEDHLRRMQQLQFATDAQVEAEWQHFIKGGR